MQRPQQPDVARTQLQVQALRAPLPPLEDAPLPLPPPPPPPGRAGSGREERCEGAENGSAPLRLRLRSDRGWGQRAAPPLLACLAARPLLARPPPGRSLSRAPAAARFFNVHRQ